MARDMVFARSVRDGDLDAVSTHPSPRIARVATLKDSVQYARYLEFTQGKQCV